MYNWLTKFLKENAWKLYLVNNISKSKFGQILNIGTGTARLAITLQKAFPNSYVIWLNGYQEILSIAGESWKTWVEYNMGWSDVL